MRVGGRVCAAAAVAVFSLIFATESAAQWPPIEPADLALKTPRVDPAADAEVLLWEVRVTDDTGMDDLSTAFEHHLRIKVFNERGRDAVSAVDLPFTNHRHVLDIKARTISPDGTITEIAGKDIKERTIIETDGLKVKTKSFVLPAVVPGAIIEYRWREVRDDEIAHDLVLPFQRDIPVQIVRYHIKPLADLSVLGYKMRTQAFNLKAPPEVVNEKNGFTLIQIRNLPAARKEAYMPHELSVRSWLFVYYADAEWNQPEQKFWANWSKSAYDSYEVQLKSNGDITQAAAAATRGATTFDEKITALVRFTREHVKRIDTDAASVRRRGKPNEGARDTLKRGTGTGDDAVVLFTTLANAAGLEARLAVMPDRDEYVALPAYKQPYFLSQLVTAVKSPTGWRFVDVANEYARNGHLRWQQEGTYALVLDGKAPSFLGIGTSQPDMSVRRSTGTLRLSSTGTVEGEVALEYTGHLASRYRGRDADETPEERQRLFTEELQSRIPDAMVSNYRTENLDNSDKPYIVRFTLSVPNGAQRTGSRLLLQPAVLEKGAPPAFTATTRAYPVYLPFAWSEEDELTFELPDGYEVESDVMPKPVVAGDGIAGHTSTVTTSGRTLSYKRAFFIGRNTIAFAPDAYPALKSFFELVHNGDTTTVSLRRSESK